MADKSPENIPAILQFYPGMKIFSECDSGGMDLVIGIAHTNFDTSRRNQYFWVVADATGKEDERGPIPLKENIVVFRPLGKIFPTAKVVADYLDDPLATEFFNALDVGLKERGLSTAVMDKKTIYNILDDVVPSVPHSKLADFARTRTNMYAAPIGSWKIDGGEFKRILDRHIPETKKYNDLEVAFKDILETEKNITRYLRRYLKNLDEEVQHNEFKEKKPLWSRTEVTEFMRNPEVGWVGKKFKMLREKFQFISQQCGYLDNLDTGLIKGEGEKPQLRKIIHADGTGEELPNHFAKEFLRNVPASRAKAFTKVQSEMEGAGELIDSALNSAKRIRRYTHIEGKINVLADPDIYTETLEALQSCKAQLDKLKTKLDTDYTDLNKKGKKY